MDLYNNLGEDRASLDLAEFVSQIAGTSASKQKYNEEFEYLQGSKERNEKFEILKKNFDEINAKIKYMEDNPANLNSNYLIFTMNLIENKIVEIYKTEQENI